MNFHNSTLHMTWNHTEQIFIQHCSTTDISLENMLYSMFMSSVMLLSVCGNSIVILAVLMSNSLKKRCTFYFVASLGEYLIIDYFMSIDLFKDFWDP